MHPALTHPAPMGARQRHRWLMVLAVVAVAVVALLLFASGAGAQVAPDGNASPDAPVSAVFTVNNTLVTLLTGLVIPLVNGALTRPENPAWVKLGLAVALSGVATLFLSAIQDDGTAPLSQEWFVQAAIVLATALGSYARIWKPLAADRGAVVSDIVSPQLGLPIARHGAQPPHDLAA